MTNDYLHLPELYAMLKAKPVKNAYTPLPASSEKEYAFSYRYRGKEWAGTLFADSRVDAECKLRAMSKGKIDGQIFMSIKVPMFTRALSWFLK